MLEKQIISLLLSLSVTLVLEMALAYLLSCRKKDLILVLLVNVTTNPPLVLFLNIFSRYQSPPWYLILNLEIAVVLIEWLLYRKRLEENKIPAFLLSLILNTISYTGGFILS